MKHLLTLKDWSRDEIKEVIDLATTIKKNPSKYYQALQSKTLIMLFEKTSTRTRLSFEAAMTQLGGHGIFLDARTSQLSMTDFDDEIRAVMRFGDCLMYRAKEYKKVERAASFNQVPVIDACSERYHPCQALGDLLTMAENSHGLENIKKIVWLGIENNVSNTLKLASSKLGIDICLVAPEKDNSCLDQELDQMADKTGKTHYSLDLKSALEEADYLHTDTWMNMEFFEEGRVRSEFKKEYDRRIKTFMPYQLNVDLLDKFCSQAKIMHCMPCHIGYEITRDAVDHPNSIIFDQAENRLHIQKAILLKLLGDKSIN